MAKENKKINILVMVGPTASGKTKVSIELAKQFNGEIISADSMQIYKDMDIGTAKPTKEEMQGVSHHLLDFLSVDEDFSVAEYVKLAKEKIKDINNRGKLPIICGGTGLYINSLIDNVTFTEQESDPAIKEELIKRFEKYGVEPLIAELSTFDEESAKKIHPNNTLRIIRAIEIYRTTGTTMSEQLRNSKLKKSPYNPIIIGLNFKNRDILYDRIDKRVDLMINTGLIEETKKIILKNPSKTAMNAICYKEILPYLQSKCTKEVAIENLKRATRRYAKRQLTWLRKDKRIKWVYIDKYENFGEILEKCTKYIDFQKNI
ncbi:MAG: tRNA dimethylallyltransferase [Eubacteriales bacterium SKADARSKE-1]|nr:tRNA dimethylallyltransferase [Eubacteriales bacterium SKADARSKE-1]